METEISIIKLVNGETLIAEVAHDDGIHLSVIDPISVNMQLRNNTPVMISTIWMPLTKAVNVFHIRHQNVILVSEVDEDMEIYYNRCIDTIRESNADGDSIFLDREEGSMSEKEIEEALFQMQEQRQPSANTSLH
tara:strand:+ start:31 stop:435 length:405 start_codon:yes stop_codon:yes gene_type:complete